MTDTANFRCRSRDETHTEAVAFGLEHPVHNYLIRAGVSLALRHLFKVRMPRRPQKADRLMQERRGYLTHAGLALMAVRARLGPA
jgi:hypothetical protein